MTRRRSTTPQMLDSSKASAVITSARARASGKRSSKERPNDRRIRGTLGCHIRNHNYAFG